MDRRQLIKQIALLTGSAVVGADFFLIGCKGKDSVPAGFFTASDISFFDEVAETIIPKTDTPGAKDAETGRFMASYAEDCYKKPDRDILKDGIKKLNDASEKMYKAGFMEISAEQKHKLLTEIDAEAKKSTQKGSEPSSPHYFTLMKQLVLLGFFTSKPGATQVLRYRPNPGPYEGCIDYKEGETNWV